MTAVGQQQTPLDYAVLTYLTLFRQLLGVQAIAIQADSTDLEAVVAAVERAVVELGGVDMLVNNANIGLLALIDDVSSGPEAGFVTGANLAIDGAFTA